MKLEDKLNQLYDVIVSSDVENFQRITDELYNKAKNDKEKNMITKFIENSLESDFRTMKEEFNLLITRAKLLEIENIISYAYIAKNYFNKSNEWLYQRIRGYNINGKTAKFSKEELNTLNFAMQDISKKIGSVTLR
jgi:hypothetical protein